MKILLDNNLTVDDYLILRKSVGWKDLTKNQIIKGIENTMYQVKATHDGKTVGMARLIGDHSFTGLLSGVIVLPEYRGSGIGTMMIEDILNHIRSLLNDGEKFQIELLPTAGKRDFYIKLGFKYKPENMDGMYLWIEK